ncbi:MAG: hypothetical protein ACTSQA_06035, partial [Candidatus Heimdallarchaeaceae archaeon]
INTLTIETKEARDVRNISIKRLDMKTEHALEEKIYYDVNFYTYLRMLLAMNDVFRRTISKDKTVYNVKNDDIVEWRENVTSYVRDTRVFGKGDR